MEAGKRRQAGDTARAATTGYVQDLRREARALKECVADLTLENRLLKNSMIADGEGDECPPCRRSPRSSPRQGKPVTWRGTVQFAWSANYLTK